MNVLEQIVEERRGDVIEAKRRVPLADLERRALGRRHRSLAGRLARGGRPCLIAEVKKASPSAGLLCPDYQPAVISRAYVDGGAAAISVLTEPRHFLGCGEDLEAVRGAVDLPVLRKDFICDAYQLVEAAAWGADVVLLIVAALSAHQLRALHESALALGLEVLVEAHTARELNLALGLERAIIGVNSRNLKTLQTDLSVAVELARHIPDGRLAVAESGIRTGDDIRRLQAAGYRGFLVGEMLMRSGDPAAGVRALLAPDG